MAFVSNGLKVGGAEKFLITLITEFADRGYPIVLILLDDNNPLVITLPTAVKVHELRRNFRFDLTLSLKFKKILLKENVKTVICVDTFPFFIAKLPFYFNKNIRFFLSLHNSLPIRRKQHYIDIVYLKTLRKEDTVIFICHYQKKCFHDLYHLNPVRSRVIYNGIDTKHFSSSKALGEIPDISFKWKSILGLDENAKTILMVGRLSVEKGHRFAIQALSHLHNQMKIKAHLIIVGTGSDIILNNLQTFCIELNIDKYVHFLGNSSEVRPYLLIADVFTLTSFSETFSIAALEAMSCGMPCSLTNVGGAAEMITNENIGLLSETRNPASIAESWNKLFTKPLSRKYISDFTETHFSKEKMMEEYLSLLAQQ